MCRSSTGGQASPEIGCLIEHACHKLWQAGCKARGWLTGCGALEEIGLLHDTEKFLFVHFTVTIAICFIDHLLQLLICHALSQLLSDTLQILEGNLSCLIIIEKAEGLQDLILWIPVEDLVCHHLEELFVFNGPATVVINIGNHLLNLLLLGLETQGAHGHLKFL